MITSKEVKYWCDSCDCPLSKLRKDKRYGIVKYRNNMIYISLDKQSTIEMGTYYDLLKNKMDKEIKDYDYESSIIKQKKNEFKNALTIIKENKTDIFDELEKLPSYLRFMANYRINSLEDKGIFFELIPDEYRYIINSYHNGEIIYSLKRSRNEEEVSPDVVYEKYMTLIAEICENIYDSIENHLDDKIPVLYKDLRKMVYEYSFDMTDEDKNSVREYLSSYFN